MSRENLTSSSRYLKALEVVLALHQNQYRKGTDIPYATHLMSVSALVIEAGGDEDEAIAALFHDAVEDQGGEVTHSMIRDEFGDNVADIVMGCTDSIEEVGAEKAPWAERKTQYLDHLKTASRSIRLVSNADKLHNARSILTDYYLIGHEIWSRFSQPKEKTLWYYRSLADEFNRNPSSLRLSKELDKVVSELEACA